MAGVAAPQLCLESRVIVKLGRKKILNIVLSIKFYNTQCRSGQNISAFASNPQQWWNGVFLERVLTPTLKICIKNTPAVTTYKALSLSESSLELQQVKRRGRIPSHWLILAWHAHIRYFCLCACVAFSMVSLTQHEPVWFQIWSVTDSRENEPGWSLNSFSIFQMCACILFLFVKRLLLLAPHANPETFWKMLLFLNLFISSKPDGRCDSLRVNEATYHLKISFWNYVTNSASRRNSH